MHLSFNRQAKMNNNKQEKSTTKRFFLRHVHISASLEKGQEYLLQDNETEIFYQLNKVFRIQQGQSIILLNNQPDREVENTEFHLKVKTVTKKTIILELIQKQAIIGKLKHPLKLALCLPNKPSKLEFILEKATELGVTEFNLIKSDLSQFSHQIRLDRLEKIVTEAAEQSEQISIPKITLIQNLDEYLKTPTTNGMVALERSENKVSILDAVATTATSILIGPEGGFSDREVELIGKSHHKIIKLGDSILKMDTAALLAVGIIALKLQQ